MDIKEILKWGLLIVIAYLSLRWLGSAVSGWVAGGIDSTSELYAAPYAAPIVGPSPVYGWTAPWQNVGQYGSGRWGPGKRYGGPHDR
jgi:hypothetical protein